MSDCEPIFDSESSSSLSSFERAHALFMHGHHEAAVEQYRLSLIEDPDHLVAHTMLAHCLLKCGKVDESASEAQLGIGRSPDFSYAHRVHSQALFAQNRFAEARTAILEAIRLDPETAIYYFDLGLIEWRSNRTAAALAAAERGLEFDPSDLQCKQLRIQMLRELGKLHAAVVASEDILSTDPEDANSHCLRGFALFDTHETAKARDHFIEALRINPDSAFARTGLAEVLKADSSIYRSWLRIHYFAAELPAYAQWGGLITGGFLVYALAGLSTGLPTAGIWIRFLALIIATFLVLFRVGRTLFNIVLLASRSGRLALSTENVTETLVVTTTFITSLSFGVCYAVSNDLNFAAYAFIFAVASVCSSNAVNCFSGWPRRTAATLTILYSAGAILGVAISQTANAFSAAHAASAVVIFLATGALANIAPRH